MVLVIVGALLLAAGVVDHQPAGIILGAFIATLGVVLDLSEHGGDRR